MIRDCPTSLIADRSFEKEENPRYLHGVAVTDPVGAEGPLSNAKKRSEVPT